MPKLVWLNVSNECLRCCWALNPCFCCAEGKGWTVESMLKQQGWPGNKSSTCWKTLGFCTFKICFSSAWETMKKILMGHRIPREGKMTLSEIWEGHPSTFILRFQQRAEPHSAVGSPLSVISSLVVSGLCFCLTWKLLIALEASSRSNGRISSSRGFFCRGTIAVGSAGCQKWRRCSSEEGLLCW